MVRYVLIRTPGYEQPVRALLCNACGESHHISHPGWFTVRDLDEKDRKWFCSPFCLHNKASHDKYASGGTVGA